jgi:hypothetical protein
MLTAMSKDIEYLDELSTMQATQAMCAAINKANASAKLAWSFFTVALI